MSSLHEQARLNKTKRLGGRTAKKQEPVTVEGVVATTRVVHGKPTVTYSTVRVARSRIVG